MYIYIHTHTHTHINICIYVYLYIYAMCSTCTYTQTCGWIILERIYNYKAQLVHPPQYKIYSELICFSFIPNEVPFRKPI